MNVTRSILRSATREKKEKLNILSYATHESVDSNLCKTGHNFYALSHPNLKKWNTKYRPVPENFIILDERGDLGIPRWVEFDLILAQNKFANFEISKQLADKMKIPLITIEHCLPDSKWSLEQIDGMKSFSGTHNIFISEYSRDKWMWNLPNTHVIHHMVDSEVFKPNPEIKRDNVILSVVNLWASRDWCCNYQGWVRTIQGLPYKVLGENPGLSEPAKDVNELVREYQKAKIFYNTSTVSPVPSSLLDGMAAGCACVSTATCMIPEIIEHGVDGFISNDENELRAYLELLLKDDELAERMGQAAREKILKKFNKDRYIKEWNKVLYGAIN